MLIKYLPEKSSITEMRDMSLLGLSLNERETKNYKNILKQLGYSLDLNNKIYKRGLE